MAGNENDRSIISQEKMHALRALIYILRSQENFFTGNKYPTSESMSHLHDNQDVEGSFLRLVVVSCSMELTCLDQCSPIDLVKLPLPSHMHLP